MTSATLQHVSLLDFIVWCASSDPGFAVEEIRDEVWEARCGGHRFRASTAMRALERLGEFYGYILHEDLGDITALCENLAPALCSA